MRGASAAPFWFSAIAAALSVTGVAIAAFVLAVDQMLPMHTAGSSRSSMFALVVMPMALRFFGRGAQRQLQRHAARLGVRLEDAAAIAALSSTRACFAVTGPSTRHLRDRSTWPVFWGNRERVLRNVSSLTRLGITSAVIMGVAHASARPRLRFCHTAVVLEVVEVDARALTLMHQLRALASRLQWRYGAACVVAVLGHAVLLPFAVFGRVAETMLGAFMASSMIALLALRTLSVPVCTPKSSSVPNSDPSA